MDNNRDVDDTLDRPTRNLPGCRPCGLSWDECELDLLESDKGQGFTICFRLAGVEWTRELATKKKGTQLRCNLQELEVLRWIAEGETPTTLPEAAHFLADCDIRYSPQKRYDCLFPHEQLEGHTAHKVLELVPDMTEAELDQVGGEAIRDSVVLLCPVPAPLCRELFHTGVAREVQKLAQHWPVRQIVCATPVEGMIDIGPVATCRNDSVRSRCTVLDARGQKTSVPPTETRTCMSPAHMARKVEYILAPGSAVRADPDLALHSSWHGDIACATQDAVLQCQYRKATVRPTRIFDAHQGMVTCEVRPTYYLTLSYCWHEWLGDKNDQLLKARLHELSRRLAIRYFWVDRLCINQGDDEDKAREIPRMRRYYEGASGCVVLTEPATKSFRCLPQHRGAILSAYQQLRENREALQSLFSCKWTTRVWALQEALLSRQVVYAVGEQLVDGDFVSELAAFVQTRSEQYTRGYGAYRWNPIDATCIHSRQFQIREDRKKIRPLIVIRTTFGGQRQYEELQRAGRLAMPFEEALTLGMDRDATKSEDCVYGLLAMCERGDQIQIEYDISWGTMLEKLQRAGMITERQLASSSVSGLSSMSWLPNCSSDAHAYGPFKHIEKLSAPVQRPRLSWSAQGATTVLGAVFVWESYELAVYGDSSIRGYLSRGVRGEIRFPDTPGLVARVGGMSSSPFTEERMRGTHVLLCRDVDDTALNTVAIKISAGNPACPVLEDEPVQRVDGYVLQFRRWVEGNPTSLKARNWTLA